MNKPTIIIVLAIIIVVIGIIAFTGNSPSTVDVTQDENPVTTSDGTGNSDRLGGTQFGANNALTVIGTSVQGRDITAYHYGTGSTHLLFVGGIHGGYEWNTALVANRLKNYLKENPAAIPANVRVTVIPVLNPDGLYQVVGTSTGDFSMDDVSDDPVKVVDGRFNGNNVDLNRNFDCDWQTASTWQNRAVSGGSAAFSEPESRAIKNYIETNRPAAVVVWYSAAGGVYASNCHNGVSAETGAILETFADASEYSAYESFDFYATTGDMTNWLAKIGIPAISVLLTNHTDIEWSKNLAGVQALLKYYAR